MNTRAHLLIIFICILFARQSQGTESIQAITVDLKTKTVFNKTAYIPSQCYTKTESRDEGKKQVYNPCYVCHTRSSEPNYVNDQELQVEYSFPEPALNNHWRNLFEDRTERIQAISDREIEHYIRQSNYLDENGNIILSRRLRNLPLSWDYNNNGSWDGYMPDCWFHFDDLGFDHTPDGGYSGWRAFAYYPFPGTYWPTNGSTDDVLIRLPQSFRVCYTCHRLKYPSIPEAAHLTETFRPAAGKGGLPPEITLLTTDPKQDLSGKWSPDAGRIVFVSNRSGSDQLWIMDADGKNQRQLTSGPTVAAWPEWSPDSRHIVFWSYDPATGMHGIEKIDIEGKQINKNRKILVQSHSMLDRPIFHPDGELIAYAAASEGNWDIWLVNADTGKKWRLTSDPQMETNPLWRPDGKALAFKVAPGGEYSLTREYFITFENGYDQPTIYRWRGPESVQMSDWSPDGKKITYTAEIIRDSSGEDRVTYVAMVSDIALNEGEAAAENTIILSRNQTLGDRGPVFSPDGEKIAFWAWDTIGNATLWLHDLNKSGLTRLTTDGADMHPQWSPDGKRLLFTSARTGNSNLMLVSISPDLTLNQRR